MVAAEHGRPNIVDEIIKSCTQRGEGTCALCCSMGDSSQSITDIRNSAKGKQKRMVAMKNKYGQTALMLAIENNHNEIAMSLLSLDISQLEHANRYGKTPLFVAIEGGNFEIARYIIDLVLAGKTLRPFHKIRIEKNGNTPMMFACMAKTTGHLDILTHILLNVRELDINATNKMGLCCFDWTLSSGNKCAMEAILDYSGFDFHYDLIERSLRTLCQNGHEDCVLFIFSRIRDRRNSRELKLKLLTTAWKNGMVRLATLYLMTNTSHAAIGTYWDMLNCPIESVFYNADELTNEEFLQRSIIMVAKTTGSLRLLFQCAALYKFHFDYLMIYLDRQKNGVAILNHYLPLLLKCLKIGLKKDSKSADESADLHGMYSESDIEAMGLSPEFKFFPKHLTDVIAVQKIVRITILLKKMSSNLHEKVDTDANLEVLEKLLLSIFNCNAFSKYTALEKFHEPHSYQNSIIRLAHAVDGGPLTELLKANISIATNSGNISPIIDQLFWGFLRDKSHYTSTEKRFGLLTRFRRARIHSTLLGFGKGNYIIPSSLSNIADLTSDMINIRYNPASMFFLEGLSRAVYFILVVVVALVSSLPHEVYLLTVVMIFSTLLYEFGEYQRDSLLPTFKLTLAKSYFSSKWNCLDLLGLSLNIAGVVIKFLNPNSTAPKAVYSVAIIFMSMSMLRYISAYEPVGHMVEVVFAQLIDILKFFVIFIFATLGFFIAMYSLAKTQPSGNFRSPSITIHTLFNSAFANYDYFDELFSDKENPYRRLSLILFMLYVLFSGVVLLNLVIARMSATHDKLDAVALQQWKSNRAKIMRTYLLLHERCPYSMLPPPFNIITAAIAFLAIPRLLWNRRHVMNSSSNTELVVTSFPGTFADIFLGAMMSFVAPIIEIVRAFVDVSWSWKFRLVLWFSIIYPLYTLSLLLEMTQLRTKIIFSKAAFCSQSFPIFYPEVTTAAASSSETCGVSHISVKVLRLKLDALSDQSCFPIVEVRLQNTAGVLEDSLFEGQAFRFIKSNLVFPVKQFDFAAKKLKLRIKVYHRNILTGNDEILCRLTVPSDLVLQWIANGRFEGHLPFDISHPKEITRWIEDGSTGGNTIQIVFKTNLNGDDNIETLFMHRENGFSSKPVSKRAHKVPQLQEDSSAKAKYASMRYVKNRLQNTLFSHSELRNLFDGVEEMVSSRI